jgi:hypothetical protein
VCVLRLRNRSDQQHAGRLQRRPQGKDQLLQALAACPRLMGWSSIGSGFEWMRRSRGMGLCRSLRHVCVWLCVVLVQLTQAVTGLSKDVQDIKSTLKDQMSPQALLATLILIVLRNAASHGQVSTGTSLSAPEVMTLCPGPGLLCVCLPALPHGSQLVSRLDLALHVFVSLCSPCPRLTRL